MQHSFDYFHVVTAMDSINVENIGECCLEICNDADYHWYMVVHTDLGNTNILSFGPLTGEGEIIRDKFVLTTNKIPYIESKIIKGIQHWIEDQKKMITQAFEIDKKDVLDKLNSINFTEVL